MYGMADEQLTTPGQFWEHFKVSRVTFDDLVRVLSHDLMPADHAVRDDLVMPYEAIGMALHFMCHKGEAESTAKVFGRGAPTVAVGRSGL